MDERWIVLLGGNPLNAGFVHVAERLGARLAVVDWNERPAVPGDLHLRVDIKDADRVQEALAPIRDAIVLAYTSADVAVETVARIHAAAGLRRPDAQALARACSKLAMNRAWEAAGLLGKRWRLCATPADLAAFTDGLEGDAIVKPVSASSSRGVSLLPAGEPYDTATVWERAAEPDPNRQVLAEEFVHGTEFTVEMVGDAYGHVRVWGISKKYHTPWNPRNKVATKLHYNAPDVPDAELERIAAFGAACYRALGLTASLGHFEMIVRPDGRLAPVEMGARSSGYIASHLVDGAAGTPGGFLAAYRAALHGGTLADGLEPAPDSSMYFFYDPPPGRWVGEGLDLTGFLPDGIASQAHDRRRLTPGQRLGVVDADFERLGLEILVGPRAGLSIDAVRAAEAALYAAAVES